MASHRGSGAHDHPGQGVVFGAFLVLLFLLPLPLGANRPWLWPLFAGGTFALLAVTATAWALGSWPISPALRAARPALALLAAWLAFGLLQVLPMPGLAAWLGRPGATVSVEPGASHAALLASSWLAVLFVLTLQLADSRRRLQVLLGVIVIVGVAQAAYGALMTLSGLEYGAFGPKRHGHGLATGTFVNRNHLAGFLELTLAVGLGTLVGQLARQDSADGTRARLRDLAAALLGPKLHLRLALVVMVIALVLTRSRMGNVAFFVSLLVTGSLALLLLRRRPRHLVLLLVSLVALDVLIIGTWFGVEQVVERLQQTGAYDPLTGRYRDADRLDVDVETLAAIADYRWFGSGGGTFYAVFPAYRPADVATFFDHAHNDYLEFLLEYGLVGIVPLLAFVVFTLGRAVHAMRQRRDGLLGGCGFATLMATVALAIHGTVDFNLHIPANAAYLMVVLALAWLAAGLPSRRRRPVGSLSHRRLND